MNVRAMLTNAFDRNVGGVDRIIRGLLALSVPVLYVTGQIAGIAAIVMATLAVLISILMRLDNDCTPAHLRMKSAPATRNLQSLILGRAGERRAQVVDMLRWPSLRVQSLARRHGVRRSNRLPAGPERRADYRAALSRCELEEGYSLPPLLFISEETAALFLGVRMPLAQAGIEFFMPRTRYSASCATIATAGMKPASARPRRTRRRTPAARGISTATPGCAGICAHSA
jgi:hypothetical protein